MSHLFKRQRDPVASQVKLIEVTNPATGEVEMVFAAVATYPSQALLSIERRKRPGARHKSKAAAASGRAAPKWEACQGGAIPKSTRRAK